MTAAKKKEEEKHALPNARQQRLAVALLCVLLSVIAVVPFFFMGRPEEGEQPAAGLEMRMPTTHDMFLHWDQMKSFHAGLKAGEVYPRWEEDTNRGFGAPTTNYYPPGVYYITSAFYALTGDWIRTLLDAQLLIMIASAAALYVYARRAMGRGGAFVAAAAYIFSPYHLIDQYQRGAIAELLAFVWFPLMLLVGEQLMRLPADAANQDSTDVDWRAQVAGIAAFGLVYGLFLWSHPATAYQASLAFAVFVGLLAILNKDWRGVLRIAAGVAIGGALGAAYMLPAAAEQELIRHEYVSETWPYHKTYVFVHDLYNREMHQEFFHRIDGIWLLGAVAIAISGLALLKFLWKPANSVSARNRVISWVAIGLFVSFMMTRYSEPLGRLIPRIDIGIFTWRMLSMTSAVSALLAGACFDAWRNGSRDKPRRDRAALGVLGIAIALGGLAFSVAYVAWPMTRAPFFQPESEHLNYAMIPRTAPEDPEEVPEDLPQAELESDNGTVNVQEWKPEKRAIKVDLESEDRLLIRTFNFPGWHASIDDQPTIIETGEELGDIEIKVPAGSHLIRLEFRNTPVRKMSSIITIFAAAAVAAGLALPRISRSRRSGP
jgi:hypothetical protein